MALSLPAMTHIGAMEILLEALAKECHAGIVSSKRGFNMIHVHNVVHLSRALENLALRGYEEARIARERCKQSALISANPEAAILADQLLRSGGFRPDSDTHEGGAQSDAPDRPPSGNNQPKASPSRRSIDPAASADRDETP